MARRTSIACTRRLVWKRRLFQTGAVLLTGLLMSGRFARPCRGQQADDWQAEVRKDVAAHEWAQAVYVLDAALARWPEDADIRAWRARVLLWSGRLEEAEREFAELVKADPGDPDLWAGLGAVYQRQRRLPDALEALDRAVRLDPERADLRTARARVLLAIGEPRSARVEFQQALRLDPTDAEARDQLASFGGEAKHELRIGSDNDLFNFTSANHDQGLSLVSRWSSRWTTSAAGNFYQIQGLSAGKFVGGVTGTAPHWGSVTIGGAVAHDNTIVPRAEAFFAADRGWRISENAPLRGVEFAYDQHWYWYSTVRVLALDQTALTYLPREWLWSLRLTQSRSEVSGADADWKPSGMSKLAFPVTHAGARRLFGNVYFAAGTEDFAQISQIGSFASQTYGGGFRFQWNARQDITGYASYQRRTLDHTDTNFGFSYGIRF